MSRAIGALLAAFAGLAAVVGCADETSGGGSATSLPVPASGTTSAPRGFVGVVNALCEQRNLAIGTMRHDVLASGGLLEVNDVTKAFAVNVLGVVRDQIPYLRLAPGAPEGWAALVADYEQRAKVANADAGDAAAVALAFFDPLRDLDRRAYDLGATSCPIRLLDGATRTPDQARYALAASEACMSLMTVYGSAVLAHGGFSLGERQLQAFRTNDDVVDELSVLLADEWATAEQTLRAIAASPGDSATVTGLIDEIDAVFAVLEMGEADARKAVLDGRRFEALSDEELERYGLLGCTLRDAL